MKTNISLLTTIAVLASALPVATKAATQVYDLSADWSDTQNPNGTWSYVWGGGLLVDTPFPWVVPGNESYSITRTTDADAVPGYLEAGDVSVSMAYYGEVGARWTAPASGTISVSGAMWDGTPCPTPDDPEFCGEVVEWALTDNGSTLTGDLWHALLGPRSSPYDLSSGSAGAEILQNIVVAKGDQVELAVYSMLGQAIGVNLTITFTSDAVDPVAALEDLADTVAAMNLQNGIENSLDAKLDAALDAIDDLNANDDVAACNALGALINAVEAQRGDKLTDAQADQLIASAEDIQAALNCGN